MMQELVGIVRKETEMIQAMEQLETDAATFRQCKGYWKQGI